MGDEEQDSGLYIDSDWKAEAAKEKERLAAEETAAKVKEAQDGPAPPASPFLDLVNTIAMQAMVALGGFQGPGGERLPPDPRAAKHFIDMMDVLKQKTEGNLSEEESAVLNGVAHDLRMNFVQMVGSAAPEAPPTAE